jgi:hypothetical protein
MIALNILSNYYGQSIMGRPETLGLSVALTTIHNIAVLLHFTLGEQRILDDYFSREIV